jgi:hypothetical protein
MDLCGFSSVNAGCVYEIGQVVNRIATSRFVFLIDESTDMNALHDTLHSAWARMDAASPNRRPDCAAIRLFRCEREQDEKGHPLVGVMRRNADCLFDLLCAGADGVRDPPKLNSIT